MVDQTDRPSKALSIWCFKDGKIGHENQSLGLIRAIGKYMPYETREFTGRASFKTAFWLMRKKFPPGNDAPPPDLIIGAGHQIHFAMLAASRANRATTIVLMNPSLPTSFFDLCLIPKHDNPPQRENIIETEGAINALAPSNKHEANTGLILVGGPSKHYVWNTETCLEQINTIIKKQTDVFWSISNSRRTPKKTSAALGKMNQENAEFVSFDNCDTGWLGSQLPKSEYTWVSEDSVSMIYESITSRCKTGILEVKKKKPNKISDSIARLIKQGMVLGFDDWLQGKALSLPGINLNEADRCAQIIIKRFING